MIGFPGPSVITLAFPAPPYPPPSGAVFGLPFSPAALAPPPPPPDPELLGLKPYPVPPGYP